MVLPLLRDQAVGDMGDFWVFGYGSLIWRPGSPMSRRGAHASMAIAGRSASILSCIAERESGPVGARPFDRGGSCIGLAFRVPGGLRDEVLAYLRERELVTNVYIERVLAVRLDKRDTTGRETTGGDDPGRDG